MKIKMTLILLLFITALYILFFLIFQSYFYFEKCFMLCSSYDGNIVSMLSYAAWSEVIAYIRDYFTFLGSMLTAMLFNWNSYKFIVICISGSFMFFAVHMLVSFLCKKLSAISDSIKELEKGSYAGGAAEKGFTSGIAAAVSSLSRKLVNEDKIRLQRDNELLARVLHTAGELKKLLATLRGNAEVLHEAGIVPETGYEGKLLATVIQNAALAEAEVDNLQEVGQKRD